MSLLSDLSRVVLVGIGATAVMDAWLAILRRMGVQSLNFAFIGRWAGHLMRGRFAHASIIGAPPIPGELALGWFTHYAVGVVFAALLAGVQGLAWIRAPSFLPAVAFGMGTVIAPLFVMQPSMGLGFAASRTPAPLKNCMRSLANHTVFGLGLYLSAAVVEWISR